MASRGKNFTEKEKCKLLELVQKYKDMIENKATNSVSIVQKNEAWACLTSEFNSTAEMPRTQKQLHTAYLNLKRVTRQNIASENVQKYLENKLVAELMDESKNEMTEVKTLLKQFKKDEIADKKGVMTTGGGTFKPVLSSIGAQMLAVMGDQVTPLTNNCDSASTYFTNDEDMMTSDVLANQDNKTKTVCQPKKKTIIRRNFKQITTNKNNETLKRQYYVKKLECALLEKKIKLIEYKTTLKKQKIVDMELKMKQNEYENMLNK